MSSTRLARRRPAFCGALVAAISITGCNASSSTEGEAVARPYTQDDLETDVADSAGLNRIVWATIADEKLPGQIAMSIAKSKPDEATATIEYGDEPKQKKVLTLNKRDGKWTIRP
jgi:hypothetical protein